MDVNQGNGIATCLIYRYVHTCVHVYIHICVYRHTFRYREALYTHTI